MSLELNPDPGGAPPTARVAWWRRHELLDALVVVVAFAVTGAFGGLVWRSLWHAPSGVVLKHQWYLRPEQLGDDFSATGLFVLVSLGASLLTATVVALVVERNELVTLAAALAGAALASWVMYAVGHRLGPADPQVLAAGAKNWTPLPADLRVAGGSHSVGWVPLPSAPFLAFPFGTAVSLLVVYLGFSWRGSHAPAPRRGAGSAPTAGFPPHPG